MTASALEGIRLIVLDLDGTLLPADKRVSERARGVIADLRAAGFTVTLATGKGWTLTRRYGEELGLESPLVALEGAYVARRQAGRDAEISSRTLDDATRAAVHDCVADLELGFFFTHVGHRTRVHRRLTDRVEQIRIWDPHVDLVDEGLHDHDEEPFVVHLVGEPGTVRSARDRLAARAFPGVELFHAEFWDGFDQLQVRPRGVGKHAGVADVLAHLGFTPAEVLACGDWHNDLDMLRMAAVAVAPSNAVPEARAAATHVLPGTCEEDAVPLFLEAALRAL